jgi:GNAT superfamily N-acetyltransferase
MVELRDVDLRRDLHDVERLWLDYLTWGNDALEAQLGVRLPVRETVDHDLATIDKFQAPAGRMVLAIAGETAIGIGCLRRIRPDIAEIKRMYVDPAQRRGGTGRAILDALIAAARNAGYRSVRLESPSFLTAAHSLYRSSSFVDIDPYPESEIADQYRSHWVFMERVLYSEENEGSL